MIQVIGRSGMLGSAVVREAVKRRIMISPHDIHLEVVDPTHITSKMVINCGGITKQRQVTAAKMMSVNAVGPHRLAEACRIRGARLIHVSTDCIFQGPGPHAETDGCDVWDIYGRSKFAGEVGGTHLTIRTSFVGFGARGLIHDMETLDSIYASRQLLWSGHTVDTIATLLLDLAAMGPHMPQGLLHVPGEFQNRWELVCKLQQRWDLPANIIQQDDYIADRRLISPRWERMLKDATWKLPTIPPFDQQLETMVRP